MTEGIPDIRVEVRGRQGTLAPCRNCGQAGAILMQQDLDVWLVCWTPGCHRAGPKAPTAEAARLAWNAAAEGTAP